jgi:nucleoside-diphosphate-sugar epimerase
MNEKIVVCGASGYIGRHLVADLVRQGHKNVWAVGRKNPDVPGSLFDRADLLDLLDCQRVCYGATQVYNLAATVGGIGFIQKHRADCMTSAAININLLRSLPKTGLLGYLFASSSCVYSSSTVPARESSVVPGNLSGYGLEKYYSEEVCRAFYEDYAVPVRIARLHTVYGPGDFRGHGRDHAPTAMAEAVVEAKFSGVHEIKVWGDGEQTRSLLYIDDAVDGIQRIMNGAYAGPVNLASSEVVTVNGVIQRLEEKAAIQLQRFYNKSGPVGEQNKITDNRLLRDLFNWEPMTSAKTGLSKLYDSAWDRRLKK